MTAPYTSERMPQSGMGSGKWRAFRTQNTIFYFAEDKQKNNSRLIPFEHYVISEEGSRYNNFPSVHVLTSKSESQLGLFRPPGPYAAEPRERDRA